MQLLHTENLSFDYPARQLLRNISIDLGAGELVILIGPNGSGKTTLIKTLQNLEKPRGNVVWSGKPLKQWPRREFARHVAYLPQTPTYDPSQIVIDTLRLGRAPHLPMMGLETTHDSEIIEQVATSLQLIELLKTPLEHLSGGQRQRVFIGRCLAQEPIALLLDEPSTYLDLRHQYDLCQLLKRLTKERGLGILMASHDLNLAAAFADRMILLNNGEIVAQGTPGDVMNPELLSKVYGLPMQRLDADAKTPWVVPVIEETRMTE